MKIKRRTLYLFRKWTAIVSSGVILFGIFYFYLQTDFFTITSYTIKGVEGETQARIESALREEATKKSFLVIPHDKILTYSKRDIVGVVRDTVSDLGAITIHLSGLHTVTIEIDHLAPAFRVGETKALTKDGIMFTPVEKIYGYPLITIASSTEEQVTLKGLPFTRLSLQGEKIDTVFLESILSMSTQVSSLIFPVESILVENGNDVTLSNASATSNVLFLRSANQKKVWSTLVSAIDTDPLKSKLSNNREGLLYLDVRYGNKVFYRFNDMSFQNRKGTAILESHATTTEAIPGATSTQH